MSGECEECSEHTLECICNRYAACRKNINDILLSQGSHPMQNLASLMLEKIKNMGIVQKYLYDLMKDEIFGGLSKHNPYWDSEHEKESEKLYDLRCKISYIHGQLEEIFEILAKSDEI